MKKLILLGILLMTISMLSKEKTNETKEEMQGVFISYIELQEQIKGKDENTAQKNIEKMIENLSQNSFNTIILQVRPNCDAIYPSKIYPYSLSVVEKEGDTTFDILDTFLTKAHQKNIKVIAWINPYRIRTTNQLELITEYSPAFPYIHTDTIFIKDGIFWNPSKKVVEDLLIEGVKELLEYPIDGLLMDDYFYPDNEIDRKDYEEYSKEHSISIEDYHLEVISNMVQRVHQECQKKKVPFGISPDGNMENNYQKHFADVKRWMQDKNMIDFIMPQIYYGFYNSTKAYTKVIHEWESYIGEDIDLYIALAFYKVGREDRYAKAGEKEWLENDNIIMREVILSRNLKNYGGFSLFRYDSIFNEKYQSSTSQLELENLKKVSK